MRRDIELGVKRSASMAKLNALKGSNLNLAALAAANGGTNTTDSPGNNSSIKDDSPKAVIKDKHSGGGSGHNSSSSGSPMKLHIESDGGEHAFHALVGSDGTPNGKGINGHHHHHHLNGTAKSATVTSSTQSALPFAPLNLTFTDVSYSVPAAKGIATDDPRFATQGPHAGNIQLLHNVSGSFRPGVLTALMGASGAGKTTLMDVLAGRKTGGKITGDIRVNGHPKESNTFSRVSAYVEQEDSHMGECTVMEALEFSAALRLPSDVPAAARRKFVEEVMELVELKKLANNMIGEVGRGHSLTIEQRKRLTIAVELVSNPSILFMVCVYVLFCCKPAHKQQNKN